MTSYLDLSRDCRAVIHTDVFGPRYCYDAVTWVLDAAAMGVPFELSSSWVAGGAARDAALFSRLVTSYDGRRGRGGWVVHRRRLLSTRCSGRSDGRARSRLPDDVEDAASRQRALSSACDGRRSMPSSSAVASLTGRALLKSRPARISSHPSFQAEPAHAWGATRFRRLSSSAKATAVPALGTRPPPSPPSPCRPAPPSSPRYCERSSRVLEGPRRQTATLGAPAFGKHGLSVLRMPLRRRPQTRPWYPRRSRRTAKANRRHAARRERDHRHRAVAAAAWPRRSRRCGMTCTCKRHDDLSQHCTCSMPARRRRATPPDAVTAEAPSNGGHGPNARRRPGATGRRRELPTGAS